MVKRAIQEIRSTDRARGGPASMRWAVSPEKKEAEQGSAFTFENEFRDPFGQYRGSFAVVNSGERSRN